MQATRDSHPLHDGFETETPCSAKTPHSAPNGRGRQSSMMRPSESVSRDGSATNRASRMCIAADLHGLQPIMRRGDVCLNR